MVGTHMTTSTQSSLGSPTATINSLLLSSDDPQALGAWYATVFDVPVDQASAPPADGGGTGGTGTDSPATEGPTYRILDLDGFFIMFDTRDDVSGPNPDGARAILNVEVDDPRAVAARLDELGARWISPLEDRGGNLFGTVADPDGNWLQIVRLSDEEEAAMAAPTSAFSGFAVRDLGETAAFYRDVLGMRVLRLPMGVLSIAINGRTAVVAYPKPDHEPAGFTVLNIPVADLDAAVDELTGKGVAFLRYDGFDQDQRGISRGDGRGPDIAWFADPSGNVISLLQG